MADEQCSDLLHDGYDGLYNDLLNGGLSKKSKHVIIQGLNLLAEYCRINNTNLATVEAMQSDQLDEFLSNFYANVRKADGSLYSKNALLTFRYGLQKHFLTRGYDIVNNKQTFASSNAMFSAVIAQLKLEGKDSVQHKQPLTFEDLEALYVSHQLDTSHPEGLQNKVFVDVMIYLCKCGRDNLREMNRRDFQISRDSEGKRYVSMSDKSSRNHQGHKSNGKRQKKRMYEMPGFRQCPVSSFEKYLSKLHPDCDFFWQAPNKQFDVHKNYSWYLNTPLGKNTLGQKMNKLSTEVGLSNVYTNHCLSMTHLTFNDLSRFNTRHATVAFGQKSEW